MVKEKNYRTKSIHIETQIKNDIRFYSPGSHILESDITKNLVKLRQILRKNE